jgi:hypothetical protein
MLVFASEFPANSTTTLADLFRVCHKWLTGSPHYGLESLPAPSVPHDEIVDVSTNGHGVWFGAATDGARALGGTRHIWVEDEKREWVTEIVAVEGDSGIWVSVNVFCNLLIAGSSRPSTNKPYVIKQLFAELGGGLDSTLQVQDSPHFLKPSDGALAAKIVTGQSPNHLPVVYVSADFDGRPFVDAKKLARRLSGMAHVLVEPDRRFSIGLARQVDAQNAYGGAVAVHWPRSNDNAIRLLPRDFESSSDIESELEQIVRSAWLFIKTSRGGTWASLREAVSARKIQSLRESGTASVDEFAREFDEETAALRDQLARANATVMHLQHTLQQAQAKASSSKDGFLRRGKEQEFYPGEIMDAILATLEEDFGSLSPDSRRSILVRDILEANKAARTDTPQNIERMIKDCLSTASKITANEVHLLRQAGFEVTDGGKHYKAVFAEDQRFKFSVHKTPSDHRSGKNLASEMIKQLFKR